MKKLLYGLAGVLLLVFLAGIGLITYVRPEKKLDLVYGNISSFEKITDMIVRRQFVLDLTSADVGQLVKRSVQDKKQINERTVITGADFHQHGNLLDADINVTYYAMPVGLHLQYSLEATGALLIAHPQSARIRSKPIPLDWLQLTDVVVDINSKLPGGPIGVKQLQFKEDGIRVQLGLNLR